MDALLAGHLQDWKIGITGSPYNNTYWLRKKEGTKPFEQWRHEKLLGKSGFGEVWRAVCSEGKENHKQLRAVKIISKNQAGLFKSSQKEIKALTILSKEPHGDLQQYIDGLAPFAEPMAAAIANQVAWALKFMDIHDFIHGDLKPQNILVVSKEPSWRVKVADFGIAKSLEGESFFTHYIGTRGYMAPELFRSPAGSSYTAAVDVWALGAVVYCLLTGDPPFDTLDGLFKFSQNLVQFPTLELGATTGFCIDFVLGAMNPDPTQRSSLDQITEHAWLSLD
ncbi:kinase-like domain-containing protein, partial [Sordaria brevicollis]